MLKRKVIIEDFELDRVQVEKTECCGIYQLYSLDKKPIVNVVAVAQELERDYPMVIFHDTIKSGRGAKVAAYIKRHKLGSVHASTIHNNPNSGNDIQMWIWYPDWAAFREFLSNVRIKDEWDDELIVPHRAE